MEAVKQPLGIKSWAEDDRPREKLLNKGRHALSEAELIAILIGSGNKHESAVELSKKILASVGNNLNELSKLSINDLMKFKGVGSAKAITIISALELGRRRKEEENEKREKIISSQVAFESMQSTFMDLPHEEFWILLLNRANKIIKKEMISRGGISGTIVDTKLILKAAIENLASSFILFHNHPSGNLKPSQQDLKMTEKIKEAATLVDLQLFDHIIVSDASYFSFNDEGII